MIIKPYTFLILTLLVVNWSVQFSDVRAAPVGQGEDIAVINQPADGDELRGVVDITGTATHPSFQFFIIEFAPAGTDQWQIVGDIQNEPRVDGLLATWDTTPIPDGVYALRLRVVRLDGNYSEFLVEGLEVANEQPLPTDTPIPAPATEELDAPPPLEFPTITPTPLPPTPTIVVEQPVVETPTPRPVETSAPLQDPDENNSIIPEVKNFSLRPLQDACLYGGGLMFTLFLFLGFLSVLRSLLRGFRENHNNKENDKDI